MKKALKDAVFNRLNNDLSASLFLMQLMSEANIYLFGGAVRDYLNGEINNARDLDFVLESKNDGFYIDISMYIYGGVTYTKNRFGGYKITFNNHLTIDVWNIQDTWAFKTNKLMTSPSNLLKSVYLNIDSVVYCLNTDKYIDNCDKSYYEIMKNGILDIVFEDNPQIELNLLRALVLRDKYKMKFSKKLEDVLFNYININRNTFIKNLLNLQKNHYKIVLLDESYLNNLEKGFRK